MSQGHPSEPKPKSRVKDFIPSSRLLTVPAAAKILKVSEEDLQKIVAATFGVLPISSIAQFTGINADTLYYAAGRAGKQSKFPGAIVPRVNVAGKSIFKGARNINILHEEFLNWVQNIYNPHVPEDQKPPLPVCTLGRTDEDGHKLYAGKSYVDRFGNEHLVPDCANPVADEHREFCSLEHWHIFSALTNRYSEMGRLGSERKGAPGMPRSRTTRPARGGQAERPPIKRITRAS